METTEKDVYVAYLGNNNAYIAMDEYTISRIPSGYLVESTNTVFGNNGFQQKAELQTDHNWQMQDLKVTVESLNIEMKASVKDGKVYLRQTQQNNLSFENVIDLQYDNYYFQYNGALIVPMIWLRGFDFDSYEKVTYQMLPVGYAEVKQLPEPVTGQGIRDFSLLMYVQNFTDIIKIQTDKSGKLLSLHSEINQLTIKILT